MGFGIGIGLGIGQPAAPPGVAVAATPSSPLAGADLGYEVTAAFGDAPYAYSVRLQQLSGGSWSNVGSALTTATGTFEGLAAGVYRVQATVTDAAAVVKVGTSREVTVYTPVSVDSVTPAPYPAVVGGTVTVTAVASGGSGTGTWDIDYGDGSPHGAAAVTTHGYGDADDYTVTATYTDSVTGDDDSDTAGLSVYDPLEITAVGLTPDDLTAPSDLDYAATAAGGDGDYDYVVQLQIPAGGGIWDDSGVPQTTAAGTFPDKAAGEYRVLVTVTSGDGQSAGPAASNSATLYTPVSIDSVTADPTEGEAPLGVDFAVTASGGSGSYTYAWDFDDADTSSLQNPSHTYAGDGTYTPTVTVTDAVTGDDDTDSPGDIEAGSAWTPADLTGFVGAPVVRDALLAGGLWQDLLKTLQATVQDDPVRVLEDPWVPGLDWESSPGMTLRTDGVSSWWVEQAGSGGFLAAAALAGTSLYAAAALRAADAAAARRVWSLSAPGVNDFSSTSRIIALMRSIAGSGVSAYCAGELGVAALSTGADAVAESRVGGGSHTVSVDGADGTSVSTGMDLDVSLVGCGCSTNADDNWSGRIYGGFLCTAVPADRGPPRDYLTALMP